MQSSFFFTVVQGQGLKTYDATFPVFLKFVLSQGWKAGGQTSLKISLFTRPGVWKPRALDFDIKPDYHHCRWWIAESKVLPICFSHHSGGKKRVAPASGFRTGAPDPYYKICLKNPFDLFPLHKHVYMHILCICMHCIYIYVHTYRYRYHLWIHIYNATSTVVTCSIMQSSTGAKNLWCNIPSVFQVCCVTGLKTWWPNIFKDFSVNKARCLKT